MILLLVGILGEDAYAFNIVEELNHRQGDLYRQDQFIQPWTVSPLKGFLTSEIGQPSTNRGGPRKRIYTITASGQLALKNSKEFKVSLWEQYPALSLGQLNFF